MNAKVKAPFKKGNKDYIVGDNYEGSEQDIKGLASYGYVSVGKDMSEPPKDKMVKRASKKKRK